MGRGFHSRVYWLARHAAAVWAPSRQSQQDITRHVGVQVTQVEYCYDSDRFTPGAADPVAGSPVLLSVSRLVPYKNQEAVIRVAARFEPRLRVRLVGSGDEHDRLADLTRQLGVAGTIEMCPTPTPSSPPTGRRRSWCARAASSFGLSADPGHRLRCPRGRVRYSAAPGVPGAGWVRLEYSSGRRCRPRGGGAPGPGARRARRLRIARLTLDAAADRFDVALGALHWPSPRSSDGPAGFPWEA